MPRKYVREISNAPIPKGPWDKEPDHAAFRRSGFACEISRGHYAQWNGYVAIPVGHPWHGKEYDKIKVTIHGGLTYTRMREDGKWWVGFDCAHYGDLVPGMLIIQRMFKLGDHSHETYKDLAYVTKEVSSLAAQAKAAAKKPRKRRK